MKKTLRCVQAAFPHTIPVLTGFSFLGFAYGILMSSRGYGILWTFLMSTFVFAGSAQYVALTFLTTVFNPLYAFLITLMLNARHLFYGISMLHKYENTGRAKPYLIFALTDETFSIVHSVEVPQDISPTRFYLTISVLNQAYWVMGSVAGGIVGSMISFNTKGLDFVLTALFVVIFTEHWKTKKNRLPEIIGIAASLLCLFIFGAENFIIPAMVLILLILTLGKKQLATTMITGHKQ